MQTLVKLMLRLTTKVAASPASSARSSSAATRISSITSGRVSAKSAVSSSSLSSSPSRPFSIARGATYGSTRALRAPAGTAAGNEAPVLELDHIEHALLHPLRIHVLRINAQPLGQRVAPRRHFASHLLRARERFPPARCGRRSRRARRGRWLPPQQARPPVARGSAESARRRLASTACTPQSGASSRRRKLPSPRRASRARCRWRRFPLAPGMPALHPSPFAGGGVGDIGDLPPVILRMRVRSSAG